MTSPERGVRRSAAYDPGCTRCPRLARFLEETRGRQPGYWAHPVPSFGAAAPTLLIVGDVVRLSTHFQSLTASMAIHPSISNLNPTQEPFA